MYHVSAQGFDERLINFIIIIDKHNTHLLELRTLGRRSEVTT